jgi:hypothetical protein
LFCNQILALQPLARLVRSQMLQAQLHSAQQAQSLGNKDITVQLEIWSFMWLVHGFLCLLHTQLNIL